MARPSTTRRCVLISFYLATLDESWGPDVPDAELARVGSHAAERYLSMVGAALCGVLRDRDGAADAERSAAVHEVRDAQIRILEALIHPVIAGHRAEAAFG
jgi:hypothetical protein